METALQTISILPENKAQLQSFVYDVKRELLSGTVKNPLKVKVQLTYIKKLIEQLLEDDEIDNVFLNEFLLYDKDEKVTISGADLRAGEVGVKYLYGDCGDPVWFDLDNKIKELSDKKKEREKFLQNIPKDTPGIVDAETGVFITRPPKTSKTKVICKI
jgi:hypothetical protein